MTLFDSILTAALAAAAVILAAPFRRILEKLVDEYWEADKRNELIERWQQRALAPIAALVLGLFALRLFIEPDSPITKGDLLFGVLTGAVAAVALMLRFVMPLTRTVGRIIEILASQRQKESL